MKTMNKRPSRCLTNKIAGERLDFMNGMKLEDVEVAIEDRATVRKIRRIVEKRVCQEYRRHSVKKAPGRMRYDEIRLQSNTMRRIYGFVPRGFIYPAM